jgi:hypothetical protein
LNTSGDKESKGEYKEKEKSVEFLWLVMKTNLVLLRDNFVKLKAKPKSKCKWVTKEAQRARINKKKAWNKYVKSGQDKTLYDEYKGKLKKSKAENIKARSKYEKKLADNIKNDNKSFYAYVNSKRKTVHKTGPLQDNQGKLVDDDKEIANLLNEYFSSVFVEEDVNNIPDPSILYQGNGNDHLDKIQISSAAVLNKLNMLNVNKSQGPDDIHGKLLYELRDKLSVPLTILFSKSLSTGVIPQDWRDANVVPLHKKGSRNKCENYRPVSLTSIVCKIFEGIIKDEITSHLNKFHILRKSQHGFTKGKSCL